MAQKDRLKFTLFGQDANGNSTSVKAKEPFGAEGSEITIARHEDYHGVFPSFSFDLSFWCNAYDWILEQYDIHGVGADIRIIIEYRCEGDSFATLYQGKVNLNGLVINRALNRVQVQIEDLGALEKLFSRAQQEVDMNKLESVEGQPLDPYLYAGYDLQLFGQAILERIRREIEDGGECYPPATSNIFPNPPPGMALQVVGGGFGIVPLNIVVKYQPAFAGVIINESNVTWGASTWSYQDTEQYPDPLPALWIAPKDDISELQLCFCYSFKYFYRYTAPNPTSPDPTAIDITWEWVLEWDNTTTVIDTPVPFFTNPPLSTGPPGQRYYTEQVDGCLDVTIPFEEVPKDSEFRIYLRGTLNADVRRAAVNASQTWFGLGVVEQNFPPFDPRVWSGEPLCISSNTCPFQLRLDTKTTFKDTTAKAWLINEAFARVIEATTDNELTVLSDYLGRPASEPLPSPSNQLGAGSSTAVTGAFQLRGFPDDKEFFLSFKTLFDSTQAVYALGMAQEFDQESSRQVIRIEPLRYFYTNDVVLTITPELTKDIVKYEEQIDDDIVFSRLDIGYARFDTEATGGLDEPVSTRQYAFNELNTVETNKQIRSEIIGSGYLIEKTRRKQFDESASEDTEEDGDAFFIRVGRVDKDVDGTTYDALEYNMQGVDSPNNLIDPDSLMNWPLTPWHMARRWWGWLAAGVKWLTQGLKFRSGRANYVAEGQSIASEDASFTANGNTFQEPNIVLHKENDNIDAAERSPVLTPIMATIDLTLSYEQFVAIRDKPYGKVVVDQGGGSWKTYYIQECKFELVTGQTELKLQEAL